MQNEVTSRAGAYGAAGTAMAVPLFWSRGTILRVKIEKMEWVGLRHANFSLARGRKEIRQRLFGNFI